MTIHDLPQDETLPQLSTVLDPQAMRSVFQHGLFDTDAAASGARLAPHWEVRDCALTWTKYRPGWDCRMAYELTLYDPAREWTLTQRLYGRIYALGRRSARDRQPPRESLVAVEAGPGFAFLPALDMIVWGFPNDRKLTGLPRLVDTQYLESKLGAALQQSVCKARDIGTQDWRIVRSETMHYVPERTCTVRTTLEGAGPLGRSARLTLYGKTYGGDEGQTTWHHMRRLCASLACQEGRLRVPEPCAYWPDAKILFQHALEGVPLADLATDRKRWLDGVRQTGIVVAALHTTDIGCLERDDTTELLDKLTHVRQLASQLRLPCADPMADIVSRLGQLAESVPRTPIVTLHGDLHSKNVLIDRRGAGLIDLDNVHRGPAWHDVGSFVAALLATGRILRWSRTASEEAAHVFLDAYQAAVPWPTDPVALRWYTALCLIAERVFRSLTRMKAGQLRLVDGFVQLSGQLLEEDHLVGSVPAVSCRGLP